MTLTMLKGRFAALAFLAALLLFLRSPSYLTHARFYAEDGVVFFYQQVTLGWQAFLHPSAGYLHVVPRLLAQLDALLPVRTEPFDYALESIVIAGVCCSIFALDHFRSIVRSDVLRIVLCLMAAAAFPEEEMVGNIANLQWFLTLAAVPLTLAPVQCRRMSCRALLVMAALLIALSAPLTIVLLPVIFVRTLRDRQFAAFDVALLAGTTVEWSVIAFHWTSHPGTGNFVHSILQMAFSVVVAVANQIIACCLIGDRNLLAVFQHGNPALGLLLLVGFVCVEAVLYRKGSSQFRAQVAFLWFLIAASVCLAMARGMAPIYAQINGLQPVGAHRYFLLGCWCFALLLILAADEFVRVWPAWKQPSAIIVVFLFGAIGNFHFFVQHTAPRWGGFAPEVQAWEADEHSGRAHAAISVPIDPQGWVIALPKLERAGR